jgi:hypothetical protein
MGVGRVVLHTIGQVPSFEGRVSGGFLLARNLQVPLYRLRIGGHRCRRRGMRIDVMQFNWS